MTKPWWVYMLRCSDGSLYTGATNDLPARVAKHRAGKGSKYVRSRLPVSVVFAKVLGTKSIALTFEAGIKRMPRREKLEIIRYEREKRKA